MVVKIMCAGLNGYLYHPPIFLIYVQLIKNLLDCRQLSELKSSKAIFVHQQAPVSCQIWFSCKGSLVNTR